MYIRPYVIINGVNSTTITGLLVTDLGVISKPLVRTLIEEVDGRDGDIVTPLGFSATDRVIKIGLTNNYDIDEVINYFNSEGVITFSNEPDKYYRFAIYEQIDFERLIRFRTAEITLHLQPFKYLVNEPAIEQAVATGSNISIYNAGNYYARPIITLTGKGSVNLTLNTFTSLLIEFDSANYETLTIDCEEMNAINTIWRTLANRQVTGNYDNIKIEKGANSLGLVGDVTTIKIENYNRWL